MKKILLFAMVAVVMAACGYKTGKAVSDADSLAVDTPQHQKYRFEHQFIMAEGNNCDSIVVKGYKDGKVAFECRHQLVDYVRTEDTEGVDWINDTVDINFDGIPDLQVYLWILTRGQVAHKYAGYVCTPQQKYEEVEEWEELLNPEVHPEDQTVTANYRSDANVRTYDTYKWTDGNKLELVKSSKRTFFGDEPIEE